ncbi:hypothetical protein [Actinoallomurus sp. CA-150999]|uniref:hypothetical protein n=1 Tax=Actinoallomurus sp. CA-150999 TaxID=3239887 RepID=UPI003D93D5A6
MTVLTYTVVTDPASLEASGTSPSPSTATVYLVVTYTGQQRDATWYSIDVVVPLGDGTDDLTPHTTQINAKGWHKDRTQPQASPVTVQQPDPKTFRLIAAGGGTLKPGDHMVLTLKNVTVAKAAGLAALTVTESAKTQGLTAKNRYTAVALAKTARAPRDFRLDHDIIDAGTTTELSWEGSADFTYEILFPGGRKPVTSSAGPQGRYTVSLKGADAPKRDTAYTLLATSTRTNQQHLLATTVQVRGPIVDELTATTSIKTGSLTADKATFDGVNTNWVQGKNTDDGWISFPKSGLNVYQNGTRTWGTVAADNADLNSVTAKKVQGAGDLTVDKLTATTSIKTGSLTADKATFDGVNTNWVQGKNTDDGWISFPKSGLNVYQNGTRTWGTVAADNADLNSVTAKKVQGAGDLTVDKLTATTSIKTGSLTADKATFDGVNTNWVQGKNTDDGWISFPKSGLNVYQNGTRTWGTVAADNADLNSVTAKKVQGRGDRNGWISFAGYGINVQQQGDDGTGAWGGVGVKWIAQH